MKQLLILAVSLLLSNVAVAEGSADNGSQYQHQTASGVFEVTPAYSYEGTTKKYKDATPKEDVTLSYEKLMLEYGINDMFSVGLVLANMDYKDESTAFTFKKDDFTDPDLFFNGRTMMGPGSLRYGLHLTVSPGKAKTESNAVDSNGYSGSTTLTPFIGYEMKSDSMTYGARVMFDIYKTPGSWEQDAATGKFQGGREVVSSIFFEQNLNPVTWGVDLQLENHSKYYLDVDEVGPQEWLPAYNRVNLSAYAAYAATDSITILPTLTFIDFSAGPKNVDSQTGFGGQIAARFAF